MAREAGSENETPNPMETSRSRSIRLVWLDPIRLPREGRAIGLRLGPLHRNGARSTEDVQLACFQ
jgi:hypothetical protein